MVTDNFYASLPRLTQFIELTDHRNYASFPQDWYVLITDVVNSTQFVEAGYYKEVNLLGASSIIAVLNQTGKVEIPFVFGGDGASLVVPPSLLARSRDALLALRQRGQERFAMELRVGVVPVETVVSAYPLLVAKLQVTPGYSQASFVGGGITYATDLVKSDPRYQLQGQPLNPEVDLSGLECRWQDIPNPHGDVVSLIVTSLAEQQASQGTTYQEVIRRINQIYGSRQQYHPISAKRLKLSFNTRKLIPEMKARAKTVNFWGRIKYLVKMLMENILGWCLMSLKLKVGNVNWGTYKEASVAASDYQKIDDVFRMVIAGKPAQTRQLQQYLEQQFQARKLVYGFHVSDRALMTCLIFENRDRHLHLIDGADGGYALAAKGMKQQIKAISAEPHRDVASDQP